MKHLKFGICFVILISFVVFPLTAFSKDKIVIGASRSLSGQHAFFEANAFGPLYKMWVDETNAQGGIFVKEYQQEIACGDARL